MAPDIHGLHVLPRFLTINQVAHLMQVSRRCVYRWIEKGQVRTIRTPGHMQRIVTRSLWKTTR